MMRYTWCWAEGFLSPVHYKPCALQAGRKNGAGRDDSQFPSCTRKFSGPELFTPTNLLPRAKQKKSALPDNACARAADRAVHSAHSAHPRLRELRCQARTGLPVGSRSPGGYPHKPPPPPARYNSRKTATRKSGWCNRSVRAHDKKKRENDTKLLKKGQNEKQTTGGWGGGGISYTKVRNKSYFFVERK